MDVSHLPSFTLEAMNAAPEESLVKAMTTGPKAMVVILRKGDKVPVNLRASLGPIALQPGKNDLVFSQDTYLYFGPSGILLSPDGKQWAPVQDGAALGKLFGLKTGTLQIGLGVEKGRGAAFTIVLERK
jgi:hypothetical protein